MEGIRSEWKCPICGKEFRDGRPDISSGTYFPKDFTWDVIDHLAMHLSHTVIALNNHAWHNRKIGGRL